MEGSVIIFGKEFEQDFLSGWIKYNRLQNHYSLEALAYGICSTSHLSYFENGKKKLRKEIIESLLRKLDICDIKELNDIGLIRQKFYNMMFQIESLNHDGAKLLYKELIEEEELIKTSPYNIEYKIYQLMYNTFVEGLKLDYLESDMQSLDKIYSSLNKELQHLYLFISGKIIYQFKSHNEGIERIETAHKIKETPWINYYLGFSYCFNNEYLKATYFLEKSLESYDKSGRYINAIWCHNYLGICYSALKIYEKAEEHFNAALTGAEHFKIKRINWHLYTNLAHLYLLRENYDECIRALELALKTDGDPVLPIANYVDIYIKLNKPEKCREMFDVYLAEEYKKSKYYYYLYFLYLSIFHFQEEVFFRDVTQKILPFYENLHNIEVCNAVKLKLIEYLENKRRYKDANKIYKELIV